MASSPFYPANHSTDEPLTVSMLNTWREQLPPAERPLSQSYTAVLCAPANPTLRWQLAAALLPIDPEWAHFMTLQLWQDSWERGQLRIAKPTRALLLSTLSHYQQIGIERAIFARCGLPYDLIHPTFRRGLVEGVVMEVATFEQLADRLVTTWPLLQLTLLPGSLSQTFDCQRVLTQFRSLHLDRCQIDDERLERFCATATLPQLHVLSLRHNHITLAGVNHLAAATAGHFPRLMTIDLTDNPGNPFAGPWAERRISSGRRITSQFESLSRKHGPLAWLQSPIEPFNETLLGTESSELDEVKRPLSKHLNLKSGTGRRPF